MLNTNMAIDWHMKRTWSVCYPGTKRVFASVDLTCRQVMKVQRWTGSTPEDFKVFVRRWGGSEYIYYEINRYTKKIKWKQKWCPDLLVPLRQLEQWEIDYVMSSDEDYETIGQKIGVPARYIPNIRTGEAARRRIRLNNGEEFPG